MFMEMNFLIVSTNIKTLEILGQYYNHVFIFNVFLILHIVHRSFDSSNHCNFSFILIFKNVKRNKMSF